MAQCLLKYKPVLSMAMAGTGNPLWSRQTYQRPHTCDSSSSSGSMSSGSADDVEFPVWLGGCQKWVTGLTKRTTCDDVIYALLVHDNNPNDVIDMQCFAIFERWRGMERPLRGRTKIIKIWRAWGSERENVKFSLRKVADPLDTSSEMSRGKRSRKPAWRDRCDKCRHGDCHKHNPKAKSVEGKYKSKAFHDLVKRILEQEKMIQEQLTRIRDTDTQIENYETKVHMARMRENGANYVQDAYLRDSDSSSSSEDLFPAIKANDLEAYARICDNILDLEDRISREEGRILDLSVRVQEESMLVLPPAPAHLLGEIETLRRQVQYSISLSQAQYQQSQLVNHTLHDCQRQMEHKQSLMHSLMSELDSDSRDVIYTDVMRPARDVSPPSDDTNDTFDTGYNEMPVDCEFALADSPPPMRLEGKQSLPPILEKPPPKPQRQTVPPVVSALSDLPFYVTKVSNYRDWKTQSDNDSNSDTGLSSLHSDDLPPVLETLV